MTHNEKTDFALFLKEQGMKITDFASKYNISYKTAQAWNSGLRKMPEYLLAIIKKNIELQKENEHLRGILKITDGSEK